MSEYSYIKLNRYMHSHPRLSRILVMLSESITLSVYIFYPIFVILAFLIFGVGGLKFALVPLISIILLSFLRAKLNLPRPYEKMEIIPLYSKKTMGKAFPSRHTFAIFIIAFSAYFANSFLFIILTILGIILALLRVLLGVHYVRDVLAGFLFAVISALIGYVII